MAPPPLYCSMLLRMYTLPLHYDRKLELSSSSSDLLSNIIAVRSRIEKAGQGSDICHHRKTLLKS
eukprot:764640-Hanusia_phi.AAC.2